MVLFGHRKTVKKRPLQKQDNRKKARIGGNAMASNPTASLGTAVLPVERKMDRWEPGPGWACPGCPLSTPEVRGWQVKGMEAGWPAGKADQQGQSALVQLEQEDTRGQRPASLLTPIHGGGLQRGGRGLFRESPERIQAVQ